MKIHRSMRPLIVLGLGIGLCVGLSAIVAANNFGQPTGFMQPGLYRLEGRVLNAKTGGPAAESQEAVQNFRTAMASVLGARNVCFTQTMTSRGASAVVAEVGEGCSFEARREDSTGFEGSLRCPGDTAPDRPARVAGRIYHNAADYTINASGPMMVGQTMNEIVFQVRFIATRAGNC